MDVQNKSVEFVPNKKVEIGLSGFKLSFDSAETTYDSVYESSPGGVDLDGLKFRARNQQEVHEVLYHAGWKIGSCECGNAGSVTLKLFVVCYGNTETDGSMLDIGTLKDYIIKLGQIDYANMNDEDLHDEKNQFDIVRYREQCAFRSPIRNDDFKVYSVNNQKWLSFQEGVPGDSPRVIFITAIDSHTTIQINFNGKAKENNFYNSKIPIKRFFENVINKTMTSAKIEYPRTLAGSA